MISSSTVQRFFFSVFFLLAATSPALALQLPPVPSSYITDTAGLLTPSQKNTLNEVLAHFEQETSNQILLAVLPDLQGESIEEFGIRLAEKWRPGHAGRDNGVILLVAPQERQVRLEVGYGLEGVLTDAVSKLILENEILPSFKRGDFYEGIQKGLGAVMQATRGEYTAPAVKKQEDLASKITGFFIAVFFLFFWYGMFRKNRAYGLGRLGWYFLPFLLGSSPRDGGRGNFGGPSGFSGGGGGFGGGGASGRW